METKVCYALLDVCRLWFMELVNACVIEIDGRRASGIPWRSERFSDVAEHGQAEEKATASLQPHTGVGTGVRIVHREDLRTFDEDGNALVFASNTVFCGAMGPYRAESITRRFKNSK